MISAARSANFRSFPVRCRSRAPYRPSITCRGCALCRAIGALACLLAAAALLGRLWFELRLLDLLVRHGREPPGAAEERLPQRQGQDPRRSARSGRRPRRTGRLAGGDGLLQGREPLPVRRLPARPHPGPRRRRSPSTSPRCRLRAKATAAESRTEGKGARAAAEAKAARTAGDGPVPGGDRKPRHPARLPRPDDGRRPRRRHRSSTTTDVDFPSNGEWRIAALIKEGDEDHRDAAAERRGRRVHRDPAGRGEGAADPHADRRGRRRRPLQDHHAHPAGHPEPGRLRRRCSARNRSSSCLRPPSSARVGSAARSSTWPSRSNSSTETRRRSSTWRSTKTTIRRRRAAAGAGPSTCRASPGCSRSTATAIVRQVVEGAFGVDRLTKVVKEVTGE